MLIIFLVLQSCKNLKSVVIIKYLKEKLLIKTIPQAKRKIFFLNKRRMIKMELKNLRDGLIAYIHKNVIKHTLKL